MLEWGSPKGEVCINGRSVYTAKHNSLNAGRAKTESYIEQGRRLAAIFFIKGSQGDVGDNASAPTSRLKSLRVLLYY